MPSALAITRSSGVVMKPRTRSALAPTYTVVTWIIEMSLRGYCRTLSERTAWRPAIKMTRFTTIASTGRLINKSVNFMHSPYPGRRADLDRQPGFLPLTFFRIRVRAVRWLYDIVDLDR